MLISFSFSRIPIKKRSGTVAKTASMALRMFIVAGEASGDALGANLIRALNSKWRGIAFTGVGGERMRSAGLQKDMHAMGAYQNRKQIERPSTRTIVCSPLVHQAGKQGEEGPLRTRYIMNTFATPFAVH